MFCPLINSGAHIFHLHMPPSLPPSRGDWHAAANPAPSSGFQQLCMNTLHSNLSNRLWTFLEVIVPITLSSDYSPVTPIENTFARHCLLVPNLPWWSLTLEPKSVIDAVKWVSCAIDRAWLTEMWKPSPAPPRPPNSAKHQTWALTVITASNK